jgi:hypothetical protein
MAGGWGLEPEKRTLSQTPAVRRLPRKKSRGGAAAQRKKHSISGARQSGSWHRRQKVTKNVFNGKHGDTSKNINAEILCLALRRRAAARESSPI